ncbi:hypothetical protein F5Y10DRAFT_290954 [Nemania abortiva]|nr:hypothetical protein F5Y10DRAFT_290954 [Nemania abortiva]
MAHISLDDQAFFTLPSAAGGKPMSRNRSPQNYQLSIASLEPLRDTQNSRSSFTEPSQADVVVIPSDSEPEDDDLDEGQSDISLPSLDELFLRAKIKASNSIASTGQPLNATSGSNNDAKEPSPTGIANLDGQRSEPPTLAAVQDSLKEPSFTQVVEPMQPTTSSWLLPKPGAGDAMDYPSLSTSPKSLSPTPLRTNLSPTNGAEDPSGADPAPRDSDTTCSSKVPDMPGPSISEEVVDLHGSRLQYDVGLLPSRGEIAQLRHSASLEPALCEAPYVSEDTTRNTAAKESADAVCLESETRPDFALLTTSSRPSNDINILQSTPSNPAMNKGSDGAAAQPQVEAIPKSLTVDVQYLPEDIGSRHGEEGAEAMQASNSRHSSPSLRI